MTGVLVTFNVSLTTVIGNYDKKIGSNCGKKIGHNYGKKQLDMISDSLVWFYTVH